VQKRRVHWARRFYFPIFYYGSMSVEEFSSRDQAEFSIIGGWLFADPAIYKVCPVKLTICSAHYQNHCIRVTKAPRFRSLASAESSAVGARRAIWLEPWHNLTADQICPPVLMLPICFYALIKLRIFQQLNKPRV
jgi:hypothetical protein